MKWPSLRSTRSEPDGPAIGIIPPGLPRLSEEGNVVNARQGNYEILQNNGWNNAALREVRRYTGNLNKADQSSVFCEGLNVKKVHKMDIPENISNVC